MSRRPNAPEQIPHTYASRPAGPTDTPLHSDPKAHADKINTPTAHALRARSTRAHLLHYGTRYKARYRTHLGILNVTDPFASEQTASGGPRYRHLRRRYGACKCCASAAADCRHEHDAPPVGHRSEHHQEHAVDGPGPAAPARRASRAGCTPGGSRAPGRGRPERPAEPRVGLHSDTGRGCRREVVGAAGPLDRARQPSRPRLLGASCRATCRATWGATCRATCKASCRATSRAVLIPDTHRGSGIRTGPTYFPAVRARSKVVRTGPSFASAGDGRGCASAARVAEQVVRYWNSRAVSRGRLGV